MSDPRYLDSTFEQMVMELYLADYYNGEGERDDWFKQEAEADGTSDEEAIELPSDVSDAEREKAIQLALALAGHATPDDMVEEDEEFLLEDE